MTVSPEAAASTFQAARPKLFGVAYRMLGSRAEAEDVVQEAYVRWHQANRDDIRSPEAWLVTTTTRLAIDRLRAAKLVRDVYPGPWLPEPLLAESPPPPDRHLELASDLSVAFILLLERLAPEERAAFLLHDVFDCGYEEIAGALGKSTAACRQIVHRARERVRRDRKRFAVTEAAKADLLRRFITAVETRDEHALLALFAPDVTWTADGGGRVPAARSPLVGRERITKLVLGLAKTAIDPLHARLHLTSVNGETGLCLRVGDEIHGIVSIDTDGERIQAVYVIVNPEKLHAKGA